MGLKLIPKADQAIIYPIGNGFIASGNVYITFGNVEISADKIEAGNVIVGLSSSGQATYESEYNGGMGSNGGSESSTTL